MYTSIKNTTHYKRILQTWRHCWCREKQFTVIGRSIMTWYRYSTTMTNINLSLQNHMMTSSNGNMFRVTGPLCGEFSGPGEFRAQRPVTRSFDVFFDLRLNSYGLSATSCTTIDRFMMTSLNRNIFRVTGPLWGESTGHRWIPLTKASDAELWCFLWSAPEQTVKQTNEMPVIWDAIALIVTSL